MIIILAVLIDKKQRYFHRIDSKKTDFLAIRYELFANRVFSFAMCLVILLFTDLWIVRKRKIVVFVVVANLIGLWRTLNTSKNKTLTYFFRFLFLVIIKKVVICFQIWENPSKFWMLLDYFLIFVSVENKKNMFYKFALKLIRRNIPRCGEKKVQTTRDVS